jgi:hypothetical protein
LGNGVDAISLSLCAVVFPELGPSQGDLVEGLGEAEGRAVGKTGEDGATGEVHPDAEDRFGGDLGSAKGGLASGGGGVEPVLGVLKSVVGGEIAAAGGEFAVDDAVEVGRGSLAGDAAGFHVHQNSADGFGAKIKAEGEMGHGILLEF